MMAFYEYGRREDDVRFDMYRGIAIGCSLMVFVSLALFINPGWLTRPGISLWYWLSSLIGLANYLSARVSYVHHTGYHPWQRRGAE